MYFGYAQEQEIRADLPQAFQKAWDIIAQPGNWFSAQERVEIAREYRAARSCTLCSTRKGALSPLAVTGEHDAGTTLSKALVDTIHRITTDASRLTKTWLDALAEDGITHGHYVELLGIVVAMISIDDFHTGLGIPLETLPNAESNEPPSQYLPPGAKDHGAWVPMVKPEDLTAPEADIYGDLPRTANVLSAMSLVPDSVRLLKTLSAAQYLVPQDVANPSASGGRAIDRLQIELLAGRVSSKNGCFY